MLKPIALFALVACLGGCAVAPGYGCYGYPDGYGNGLRNGAVLLRVIRLSTAAASTSVEAGAAMTIMAATGMAGTTGTEAAITVAVDGTAAGATAVAGQWQGGGGHASGGGHGGGRG